MKSVLSAFVGCGSIKHFRSVAVKGTTHEHNMAVVIAIACALPVFGIIMMTLVTDSGECCFICAVCETGYSQHLHCYELKQSDEVQVVNQTDLDYYPLYVYHVVDADYVSMKHFVDDIPL